MYPEEVPRLPSRSLDTPPPAGYNWRNTQSEGDLLERKYEKGPCNPAYAGSHRLHGPELPLRTDRPDLHGGVPCAVGPAHGEHDPPDDPGLERKIIKSLPPGMDLRVLINR